jgi:hypothetical protein
MSYTPTWRNKIPAEVVNEATLAAWNGLLPEQQELLMPFLKEWVSRYRGLGAKGGREVLAAIGLLMAGKSVKEAG